MYHAPETEFQWARVDSPELRVPNRHGRQEYLDSPR